MTKGKWFAFIAVLMLGLLMIPNVGEAEIDSGEGWELTDDWVLNIYANIETSHDYAPWSSYLSRVREIDIELGVTSIGDYAFDGFYYTKSISIPDSVTSIGNSAFSNCRSLSSIHIPDSVVFIGQDAFSSCNNLTSIYVDTLEQWLSYDHAATDLFPRSPSFGDNSLYVSGKLLTDAQIPDSIISINDYAFYNCRSLKSVSIPDSVTAIGDGAFRECTNIENISISDSVTHIGNYAFYLCYYLNEISIPDSVTQIGNYAFYGCRYLKKISIPYFVTCIGDSVFSCSGIESISLPDSIISIGDNAFSHSPLKSISLPNSIVSIGQQAFYNCYELKSIDIPASVIYIGNAAFDECSNLCRIEIDTFEQWLSYDHAKTSLYCRGDHCLLTINEIGVTDVVIPNSITSIDSYTFLGCPLKSIYIPASVTSIADGAFKSYSILESIYVDTLEQWLSYSHSTTGLYLSPEEHWHYPAKDGLLYINGEPLSDVLLPNSIVAIDGYTFANCSSLTSISIPNSVTSIGEQAFLGCSNLTSIPIPNSVTSIGNQTFAGCSSLTNVSIPNSVTSIGSQTFDGCSSLTNVSIPNSVTSIGEQAFRDCASLSSLALPECVSYIECETFINCSSLSSISIPRSVTYIASSAFASCNKLKKVLYGGDRLDRAKLHIGDGNSLLSSSDWYYSPSGSCGKRLNYTIDSSGTLTISGYGAMDEFSSFNHPWDEKLIKAVCVGANVFSLTSEAFYGSPDLEKIFFEGYTCRFGSKLFSSYKPTVYCYKGSDADSWAQGNGLPLVYFDDCTFSEYGTVKAYASTDDDTHVTSISLMHGTQQQLFVSILPNIRAVQWSSSNTSVATVDESGLVTACRAGDAVITAQVEDATSEVSIHVTCYGDIGSVAIENAPAYLRCNRSVTLKAVPTPAYDFLTYQWSSSNDNVLSVDKNGVVTAHSKGTATITVNVDGAEASATITAYETPLTSLSLSEGWGVVSSPVALHWTCEPSNADPLLHWTAEMPSQASSKVSITDDGVLTSSALGDVIVTVTDDISGITATTTVHILAPVKAISVPEAQTVDACVGEYQLEAAVTTRRNDTLVNKLVTFATKQPDVAKVDENGLITIKAPGTASITVTAESGASAVFTLNVNPAHTHRTKHPFSTGTCLTCGNTAYESCDSCGRYFVVDNGNLAEIANGSWYIKGWHHYENGTCKDCGQHFDWSGLNTLTLPAAIKEVEPEAFMNVSTQVIIVPNGCVTIGSRAFANCTNLRYVILPSTLETLADDAFAGCGSNVEFIWQ